MFFPNRAYQYFLSFIVLLGSTPEVPAGSCQEIKASEGEEAATGMILDELKPLLISGKVYFLVMIIHRNGLFNFL